MSFFLFSNETYLLRIAELRQEGLQINAELFLRLGVKQKKGVITMIVIANNEWDGHNVLSDLQIECEKLYHKRIDSAKIRSIVLRDIEQASKSPHLEQASFIIFLDGNLLGAENYPELEKILPFMN